MNKVLQDLMEHLECPVCLHYMSFPITLCRNGHNICARCKYRLPLCPLCNGKFTNIRSIALENMAARIKETVNNLEELVCRICQEYMVPPIPQCTICGIHMCNYCENMKRHCHFRISEVAFIRNGALEAISRQITHRCQFFKSGCTGQFLADFKKEHEEVCWFRDVSCPFDIGYRCGWRGSLHSTSQHIIRSHVYNVLTEASLTEKQYHQHAARFSSLGQLMFPGTPRQFSHLCFGVDVERGSSYVIHTAAARKLLALAYIVRSATFSCIEVVKYPQNSFLLFEYDVNFNAAATPK
ncbi:hypothetical protein C0J52_20426 [Blattella germanica]|nr:hypothetical protein C0J52_20426 [Blattella germanica]